METPIEELIQFLKINKYETISIEMLEKNILPIFLEKEKQHMKEAALSNCTGNKIFRVIFENQFEHYFKDKYKMAKNDKER